MPRITARAVGITALRTATTSPRLRGTRRPNARANPSNPTPTIPEYIATRMKICPRSENGAGAAAAMRPIATSCEVHAPMTRTATTWRWDTLVLSVMPPMGLHLKDFVQTRLQPATAVDDPLPSEPELRLKTCGVEAMSRVGFEPTQVWLKARCPTVLGDRLTRNGPRPI